MTQILFSSLLALSSSFFITVSSHAANFSLHSSSFKASSTIPALYTCDGRGLSPELSWQGVPAKTEAFALITADPDAPAGTWYHWVIYNIPASVSEIPQGEILPAGAMLGTNSQGKTEYQGPCPPTTTIHRYVFTLYALDKKLSLPEGVDAKTLERAMQGHVLGKTSILGVFGH